MQDFQGKTLDAEQHIEKWGSSHVKAGIVRSMPPGLF
ncbi:hypothetical protein A2U01_0083297 [Trifolium medium]|uniref:Uncharacterized protein n=1 Tax=Trifolium medium TaxID=97028 RepID=A0A392TPF0_9FABA|nr:hypothetical protein [Trifolium medium]